MKIDGISIQAKPFIKAETQGPVESEVENTLQTPQEPAQIVEPTSPEPESESKENDTEKGVLRNLLAGHYKGVSDVRLRINFFEELTAIEAAEVQTVTAEKVGGVLESVGGLVRDFVEGDNKLTPEQSASVIELHDTFAKAAGESQNEPAADLTSAFDDFVKGLRDLFAPPVKTPEETAITETEEEDITKSSSTTELPWLTFLDNLQSAFTTASDELTKAVTGLHVLPELSEPNGNGVAYEKFLAIYNDLRGLNAPVAEQPVNELIDVVV